MHRDSIKPGDRVVLVDDLIATGGTIEACARMVEGLGGEVVRMIFVMELAGDVYKRQDVSVYHQPVHGDFGLCRSVSSDAGE